MNEILSEIKRRCLFRLKIQSSDRLDKELDWIHDNGGAEALFMMSDFARHLKKKGIYVGAGSKNECCSLVCYGLGISNINPTTWGLPFKLFADAFKNEHVLYIDSSKGGVDELGFFKEHADYIEGVNLDTRTHTAEVTFLNDNNVGNCVFVVEEYAELNLLKAFQETRTKDIRDIKLDEMLLKNIHDDGFSGFSLMANLRMKPLIDEFGPDCFSDFCILFSTFGESKRALREQIINARKTGGSLAMKNENAARILAETYGIPLYEEQFILLEEAGIPIARELENYPSKSVAVSVVSEAVIATAFRYMSPEAFNAAYGPQKDLERERRIDKIAAVRKKLRNSKY